MSDEPRNMCDNCNPDDPADPKRGYVIHKGGNYCCKACAFEHTWESKARALLSLGDKLVEHNHYLMRFSPRETERVIENLIDQIWRELHCEIEDDAE